jgi:hypothetical protein
VARLQVIRAATRTGCPKGLYVVTTDQRPSDIQDYTGVRDTPLILGAVLALAVRTLAHVLLTGVRRRRADLAVLRPLACPVPAAPGGVLAGQRWPRQPCHWACRYLLVTRWAWPCSQIGRRRGRPYPRADRAAVIPVTLLASLLAASRMGGRGSGPRLLHAE